MPPVHRRLHINLDTTLGWEFSSGYGPHQARIEASRTEVVKQVGEVGGKEGNEEDRLATHV